MFCECPRFIYPFYHIKYFEIHNFHLLATYSSDSITVPVTPVNTKDEWVVKRFVKIQINRRWSGHALLITHGYTF